MSHKLKYPAALAFDVAMEVCEMLAPVTERRIVAGSLRRQRETVGDVEVMYIPRFEARDVDWFGSETINLAEERIGQLERAGVLTRRTNVKGAEMFGPKNKFMRHVQTGVPVDLFSATKENWFNYLVCRTGPSESNIAICNAALARGLKWKPYGPGFVDEEGFVLLVHAERDVFDIVGLPYREPEHRSGCPNEGVEL